MFKNILSVLTILYLLDPTESFKYLNDGLKITVNDENTTSICAYLNSKELSDALKNVTGRIKILQIRNLQLTEENGILSQGWLNCTTPNNTNEFIVDELWLENSKVRDISVNAFVGNIFDKLNGLVLNDFAAKPFHFRAGMLNGLNNLKLLGFSHIDILNIDENFLQPIEHTLKIVQFDLQRNLKSSMLKKLLSIKLGNKAEIKFSGTTIDHIEKDTFQAQTNLWALRFNNMKNQLSIDKHILDPLESLRWLDFTHSTITTLPAGLFDNHLKKTEFTVLLNGSNWQCDCNANYLIEANKIAMKSSNNQLFNNEIVCGHPFHLAGKKLLTDDLNVCPDVYTDIKCPLSTNNNIARSHQPNIRVPVTLKKFNFTITRITQEKILIDLLDETIDSTLSIIWYNDRYQSIENRTLRIFNGSLSCLAVENSSIIIENLEPDTNYTFCIISTDYDKFQLMPFNCDTYSTAEVIFVNNKHTDNSIYRLISIILLCLLVGVFIISVIIFIYVYRHFSLQIIAMKSEISAYKERYFIIKSQIERKRISKGNNLNTAQGIGISTPLPKPDNPLQNNLQSNRRNKTSSVVYANDNENIYLAVE